MLTTATAAVFLRCADCASPISRQWARRCKVCGVTLGPVCSASHVCVAPVTPKAVGLFANGQDKERPHGSAE